ncbi:MAG: hypothetical protein ABIA37_02220 [Candidatus Woesearchaeota archaeon]
MDIKKELSSNQTVLLLMPSTEYNENIVEVVKQLSGKSVCYVTLNKTFDSLKELFEKKKIDTKNIVFIDAISKTIKKVPSQTDRCYFCSSPGALTEISLAVSKFLKHNFEYLIFDSLTNLLIYQKKVPVAQFVSTLVNRIKDSKTKAVFYALSVQEQEELIQESGMFVDEVIDLRKEE